MILFSALCFLSMARTRRTHVAHPRRTIPREKSEYEIFHPTFFVTALNSDMPPMLAIRFRREEDDVDQREVLEKDVHVVVHDRAASVHKPGKNGGEDLGLLGALEIIQDDVVEHLGLLLRQPEFLRGGAHLGEGAAVGLDGVQIVDERFSEGEHLEQVPVLHRRADLGFEIDGELLYGFEMVEVMMHGVQEEFEQHVDRRTDPLKFLGRERDAALAHDHVKHASVVEKPRRGNVQPQALVDREVFRPLPDDINALAVELNARDLVGIERRFDVVGIEPYHVRYLALLLLPGSHVHVHVDPPAGGWDDRTVNKFKGAFHLPPPFRSGRLPRIRPRTLTAGAQPRYGHVMEISATATMVIQRPPFIQTPSCAPLKNYLFPVCSDKEAAVTMRSMIAGRPGFACAFFRSGPGRPRASPLEIPPDNG